MNQVTFVEKVAHKISSLGLTAPAILFLEAHKPLAFLSSQLLLIAQPTLNLFVSSHSTRSMVDFLADPTQLEQLMTHLEQKTFPILDPLETPLSRPDIQNAKLGDLPLSQSAEAAPTPPEPGVGARPAIFRIGSKENGP